MKKCIYQITRKIYFVFLFFLLSSQAFSDPYYWGCKIWKFMPGGGLICIEYGYVQTPEIMDLCTGDEITLYAKIPDAITCSYQWYVSY